MEFILFIILVLLIVLISKTNSNYSVLKRSIEELTEKISDLSKEIPKVTEKKSNTIAEDPQPPIISKNIEDTLPPSIPLKEKVDKEINISHAKITSEPIFEKQKEHTIIEEPLEENFKTLYTPKPLKKSYWEKFKEKNPDLEKFIGENLINKIGILILVLGISYFVKYAIDKDWINEPARVGIGILAGALVMLIAHRLRKNYGSFSSVLVAGAIAIFYFTIGIAFHEYRLFNQTVAFAIMVVITAFSSVISISYNRMELAILSLIGGFAVPFMISTGTGNYIVLFTYIIILNIGILSMAYYKKWNLVNVLAFIFTTLLFGGWFIQEIISEEPHYLDALIFSFAFYLIFIITNIINNIRTKGTFSKIQLSILVVNTFVFYAIGMVIFSDFHSELKGIFTIALGLLNFIYAWLLYKKFQLDKIAVYLLIGLTLTFITLAIPIQFQGNYITLFWAAEAVLLMWLAKKSKIKSYRFASVIVHALMMISLLLDWEQKYFSTAHLNIIINPIFATGLFALLSIFSVHYLLKNENEILKKWNFVFNPIIYRNFMGIAGIILGYIVGLLEVLYQSNYYIENTASALSLSAVYHLLFTAIVSFILYKKKTKLGIQLMNIIAIFNITLFILYISILAFSEHKEYLSTGVHTEIAFYLHYISLAFIIYFAYLLYNSNKQKVVFPIFENKLFIWLAAIAVIFITSSELMLHGLKILNSPVTVEQLKANEYYELYKNDLFYLYDTTVTSMINQAKLKITKTSFPVLWGVLAFVFLIIGIKKQIKTLRIVALVLLAVTIVKLFVFDITNVSETGKIIAFILLGILILIISYVYQKIKVLILDDEDDNVKQENEEL
ncbi:DUF2339 domain-containing protein [Aureibaculum luteum]|uniref:DUF2339 domain-containing protein n=1 Tax=Aureibaculum luteum TaxID=1548456 RepID=UPI000E490A59|nr:DUF2339 domain-containing protein [Aureibaculum luteum]